VVGDQKQPDDSSPASPAADADSQSGGSGALEPHSGEEKAAMEELQAASVSEESPKDAVTILLTGLAQSAPGLFNSAVVEASKALGNRKDLRSLEAELEQEERVRQAELDAEERQQERLAQRAGQEQRLTERVYAQRARVAWIEAWIRAGLAVLLVAGTVAAVFLGIAMRLDPEQLAQYLAPITGLAGLAVGYIFGRGAASGGENTQNSQSPSV
jgi:hypothetical protein